MQNLGLQYLVLSIIFYALPPFLNKELKFTVLQCTDHYCNAGEAVTVEDEVVVTSSIVLPNKTLNVSVQDEIIL